MLWHRIYSTQPSAELATAMLMPTAQVFWKRTRWQVNSWSGLMQTQLLREMMCSVWLPVGATLGSEFCTLCRAESSVNKNITCSVFVFIFHLMCLLVVFFGLACTAWFKAVVSPGGPGRAGVLQQSWDGLSRRMGCAVGLERMRLEEGCPVFVCFLYVFRHQQPQQWRADVRVRSSALKKVDVKTVRLRNRFVHSQKHSDCQVKYQCQGHEKNWDLRLIPVHRELMNHASRRGLRPDLFSPDIEALNLRSWRPAIWVLVFSQLELLTPGWKQTIHVSVVSSAFILRIHVIILPYAIYERNNIP